MKEPLADIAESLNEESVTAQVGVWIKRSQAQEYHHRLTQRIRRLNSHIQRRIIQGSLGALHPVDNAPPFGVGWPSSPHCHSRVGS